MNSQSDRFDQRSDVSPFVDAEVVEDHDLAGDQRWHEHLLDIGGEGIAVHGSFQSHRRLESMRREGGDESGVAVIVARSTAVDALIAGSPAGTRGQGDVGARLVEEDELLGSPAQPCRPTTAAELPRPARWPPASFFPGPPEPSLSVRLMVAVLTRTPWLSAHMAHCCSSVASSCARSWASKL